MNTKLVFLLIGFFLITNSLFAQFAQVDPDATGYYTDALRFSQTTPGGTARFQGLGGVNNALGADLSSLAGNPAGLGFYQKSDIGITTGFGFGSSNSTYLNGARADQRDYFYFPNLGMSFTSRKDETEEGAFRGRSFGIGLTRIANFQNQFSYSGTNANNSIADYFQDITNGTPQSDLWDQETEIETLQALAYWSYIIDGVDPSDANETEYYNFVGNSSVKQEETVLTRGAINQWNFSYGGNFNDQFYIGASVGVPMIRYKVTKNYKETVFDNDSVSTIRFGEELNIRGTGINFKVGMIVKPQDWLRVGLTLTSPTYYGINEDYSYSARTVFIGSASTYSRNEKTTPGTYKYNLVSPFRAAGGIAIFAGKAGFISADIEYVPYSRAVLKESSVYATTDAATFPGDNNTIRSIYKPAMNILVGGEFRHKIYRFRGGFSWIGDGYNNIDETDRKVINISGGAGVRLENYYFDIALVNSRFNSTYRPYTLSNGTEPTAFVKSKSTNFVMSAGVFF